MEHPNLDVTKIKSDLSLEDIQQKILDLRQRISFAYQMNNQPMLHQLEMILAVYTRSQNEILEEMYKSSDQNLDDQIDVS